jgi:hypothetical protein
MPTHKSAYRILRRTPAGVSRRCLQFSHRFWGCRATGGNPGPSQGHWLEKAPGEALAVGAMTDRCHLWLDVCRVSDRATMASAVDLHEKPHAPRRAGYAHAPSSTTISSEAGRSARLSNDQMASPAVNSVEEGNFRLAQIVFSNESRAGGSSGCRRFRVPVFSACSFGT